jgi:hypothetical protein
MPVLPLTMSNTSLDCVHIDQSVLVHLPDKPTSVGVLPFAKNTTEFIVWHWDTECYDRFTFLRTLAFGLNTPT